MASEIRETTPDGRWPVVRCTACDAAFPVDPEKVPEEGVLARCSECAYVFPVDRPDWATERSEAAITPIAEGGTAPLADLRSQPVEPSHDPAPELPPLSPFPDPPPPPLTSDTDWASFDATPATVDSARTEEAQVHETVEELPHPEVGESAEEVAVETGPDEGSESPEAVPDQTVEAPATGRRPFSFGRSDPHERAARLARVLVSDMITYHRDQYETSLTNGTLREDFEEEIGRSREEYVERVGQELADQTSYFRDALNEVLSKGEELF